MTSIAACIGLLAYVGPGPGLSMTAALLGLIVTILLALLAFFSWPLRVLLRKIRGPGDADSTPDDGEIAVAADDPGASDEEE
jgi:hypothetical protein